MSLSREGIIWKEKKLATTLRERNFLLFCELGWKTDKPLTLTGSFCFYPILEVNNSTFPVKYRSTAHELSWGVGSIKNVCILSERICWLEDI